ncbi:unnamed protein product [Paramecium primaurelia]|uniref:Uncharacterized protein n=1 Tax=Paramecium primaurelia TaxID=5886 RepID=A0A8S1JP84_PARPR|nr:unnamed protein product [Paramecium primaurelia]
MRHKPQAQVPQKPGLTNDQIRKAFNFLIQKELEEQIEVNQSQLRRIQILIKNFTNSHMILEIETEEYQVPDKRQN